MKLDICIPAYNEASIIADAVQTVRAELLKLPSVSSRVIVADNASTDGTGDIVRSLALPNVLVLMVPEQGKGAAVIAAARASDADLFGFIDADLSAHPEHFTALVAAISKNADIAVGSRLHPDASIDRGFARTASSRAFNFLRRLIVGIPVRDSQCGIKLTGKKGLEHLRACVETGWFFEIEWLRRAERDGLTIAELPISWQEFRYKGRLSKLNVIRDGFAALAAFLRIRRAQRK